MRRGVVGVAIGADGVYAAWRDRRGEERRWSTRLTGPSFADALPAAFDELACAIAGKSKTIAIAVLPPVARLRRIDLPAMSADDARLVIARSASRHFLFVEEPVVCGVERAGAGTVIAGAVSATFLDALASGAQGAGLVIERVVPAHASWRNAAVARNASLASAGGSVFVHGASEATAFTVEKGRVTHVRRLVNGAQAGDAYVLTRDAEDAAFIAAANASGVSSLELMSESTRRSIHRRARRVATALAAASVACLVAAAGVYRLGLSREADAIAAERGRIARSVNAAVGARDTLAALTRSLDAISTLETTSPRWSAVVARIAGALPQDATLAVLRGDADSVSLDGQAQNGAAVFTALRGAPGVLAVRPTAPIRQEAVPGQQPLEHWTVTTQIHHATAISGGKRR